MSEPFLGMIIIVPYNFSPRGWAFCNGQILPIAQNTALFSLLGTTFGGNGQTTFALPDLRSRVPLHSGQGPGLSSYDLGEQTGTESVTLNVQTLPGHTHTSVPSCSSQAASSSKPSGLVPSAGGTYNNAPDGTMGAGNTGATGGNAPVPIIQPILALNFCIALEGIYPSRN
jgi:microcystin-dependent protein